VKELLVRRLLAAVPTLIAVSIASFLLIHLLPGDPVDFMLGEQALPGAKEELRRALHLDRALPVQYGLFLRDLVTGRLTSLHTHEPVLPTLAVRFGWTLLLTVAAMTIALCIAIPAGAYSAVKAGTLPDHAAMTLALLGVSMPTFWLGPLLIERYGFSLVQSGNVALAVSLVGLFGPPVFGRLDPKNAAQRRRWIVALTLLMAGLFLVLAFAPTAPVSVAVSIAIGFLCGYIVLQYADVRAAYPEALTGRAMAVFTMAMFLGIALMQWVTGVVASIATAQGVEPFTAVLATVATLLAAGTAAFASLPAAHTRRA
jgi:ABC-type antimicrobial peptide transport system permease subunit